MVLDRLIERLRRGAGGEQARRVRRVVDREASYHDPAAFLDALLEAVEGDPALEGTTLFHVTRAVRDHYVDYDGPADFDEHLRFWAELSRRFPGDAYVLACHGDALLLSGQEKDGVGRFLDAFERDPLLVQEFDGAVEGAARRLGGTAWLRFRLVLLRAALRADPELDLAGDEIRERYAELLDEYGDDPDSVARVREVGKEIRALEAQDRLPRAIVRRTRSRE